MSTSAKERKALFDLVAVSGRDMTAQGVMYYSVIAEHHGLSVADWRALDLLHRYGPMTAGQFSTFTGLTPGGVTALVNRLEKAGAVLRKADEGDGRKVIVTARPATGSGKAAAIDASLQASLRALYRRHSDEELRVIGEFMRAAAGLIRDETAKLRSRLSRGSQKQAPATADKSRRRARRTV